MTDRLVLGSGPLVERVATSLQDVPGTVRVGTQDDDLVVTLRDSGITVDQFDPTDASTLGRLGGVDLVFVCCEDERENHPVVRAARTAFPDAYLLTCDSNGDAEGVGSNVGIAVAGGDEVIQDASSVPGLSDGIFDPVGVVAESIVRRVGDSGRRLRDLVSVLRDIDRLLVLTHDNPDPDAIASGVALARVAEAAGCSAEVCYFGAISHQENRAFVNVLELELRNLDEGEDVSEFDGIALVDHARPGVNNQLPEDTDIDIVIDHHPPRAPIDARFVDLRSAVGATSTMLVDYLDRFEMELEEDVATALLFGIHVDTDSFSRGTSREDFEAGALLVEYADLGTLERIESPRIDAGTIDTIASAITNRRIEGAVAHSCVSYLSNRDALAQAADRLMMLDGITTTMVYGVMDGTIYVSARSRNSAIDIGETLRLAFDRIGSAGGHVDMAGAQIELGILDAVEDRDESLQEIVETVVTNQFLEALAASTGPQGMEDYRSHIDVTDEYIVLDEEAMDRANESRDAEEPRDPGESHE